MFFEVFGGEIKRGQAIISLTLVKQSSMMILDFRINGSFEAQCDRCAISSRMPIQGEQQLIVKFGGEEKLDQDGMALMLPYSESEIDLSSYIYEYIRLSLPVKNVPCETFNNYALCDQEMLKKISDLEQKGEEKTDERWDKLKSIKIK